MAKGIRVGVSDVARKTKVLSGGVSNTTRRLKSGFVGVNSLARQSWPDMATEPPPFKVTNYRDVPSTALLLCQRVVDSGRVFYGYPSASGISLNGVTAYMPVTYDAYENVVKNLIRNSGPQGVVNMIYGIVGNYRANVVNIPVGRYFFVEIDWQANISGVAGHPQTVWLGNASGTGWTKLTSLTTYV